LTPVRAVAGSISEIYSAGLIADDGVLVSQPRLQRPGGEALTARVVVLCESMALRTRASTRRVEARCAQEEVSVHVALDRVMDTMRSSVPFDGRLRLSRCWFRCARLQYAQERTSQGGNRAPGCFAWAATRWPYMSVW
jgi:hypothetical protein